MHHVVTAVAVLVLIAIQCSAEIRGVTDEMDKKERVLLSSLQGPFLLSSVFQDVAFPQLHKNHHQRLQTTCTMKAPLLTPDGEMHSITASCPQHREAVLCIGENCYEVPPEEQKKRLMFESITGPTNISCSCSVEGKLHSPTWHIARPAFFHFQPEWQHNIVSSDDPQLRVLMSVVGEVISPRYVSLAAKAAMCEEYTNDACNSRQLCHNFGHQTTFGERDQTKLAFLLKHVMLEKSVPGDIIEVGCWRGGMTVAMAKVLQFLEQDRVVYALDSFQGHPELQGELKEFSGSDCRFLHASFDNVQRLMHATDVKDHVVLKQGWINESLPLFVHDLELSVLFVDVDSYDAIKYALDTLYPRLQPGGLVVIDDYNYYLEARVAVMDFLFENDITAPLLSGYISDRVMWFKE